MVPLLHTSFRTLHPMHFHLNRKQSKNRTFLRLYKVIKFICLALWAISQTHMSDFPTLLKTSTSKIPTLSYNFCWQMVPLLHTSFRTLHPMHCHLHRDQSKNKMFPRLYKVIKFICSALWAISQTEMTDFPTLLKTSTSKIPTLSYTWSLKKYHLRAGLPRIGP